MPRKLQIDHVLYIATFIIALFLAFHTTYPDRSSAFIGAVLGDDDERDDSDKEKKKEEKKKKDAEKKAKEEKKKTEKSSNSGSGSSGSENKKIKTREMIQNSDGTTQEVRYEQKGDEIKTEIRIYDVDGNKIEVQKHEEKNGREDTRSVTYDELGNKLSDVRLRTVDGKTLDLKIQEGSESSRVRYDVNKQELVIRENTSGEDGLPDTDDDMSRIRIRTEGDNFILQRSGVSANINFPITIDDATGQIFVTTPNGNIELKAMPDIITEKASNTIDNVSDVSLEVDTDNSVNYVVTGTKSEQLLGFFTLQIPTKVVYDSETGQFIKSDTPFIYRVLDLFSF